MTINNIYKGFGFYMLMILLYILIATFVVSLISLVGLIVAANKIKTFLTYFVAFSAGGLLAAALFDLIPEAIKEVKSLESGLVFVGIGILFFFVMESFMHWKGGHSHGPGHGHDHVHINSKKPAGALVFSAAMLHNFTDGLVIAGAFLLNISIGVITTLLVAIHEIPHEFGDFALFLHSGYSKWQAVKINFLSAISAVVGGIAGFFALEQVNSIVGYVVLFAAGGFLYIALSNIVPELHTSEGGKQKLIEGIIFIASFVVIGIFLKLLGV